MPFQSSAERLESLLVIQPHLSWWRWVRDMVGVIPARTGSGQQLQKRSAGRRPSAVWPLRSPPDNTLLVPLVLLGTKTLQTRLVRPQIHLTITGKFSLDHLVEKKMGGQEP